MKPLLLAFLIATTGCGNASVINLGGGYFLATHDRDHRYIYKTEERTSRVVIDQQIVGYHINGSHILVHRMVAASYECVDASGRATIFTKYSNKDEFWIIDSADEKISGPLDRSSFENNLTKKDLATSSITNDVEYRSNVAAFEKQTEKCIALRPI